PMIQYTIKYHTVPDIPLAELKRRGLRLLLVDVDNTLAPYYVGEPTEAIRAWVEALRGEGIEVLIFSNNKTDRPARFAQLLGVDFRKRVRKPHPEGVWALLREKGLRRDQVAVVGDQIYTDILCAQRAGVTGILVDPIRLVRPIHILRFLAELPFRR
ncbi:MAG: YqeG family HAD IIIA-type phosphatase, partial [bacterium]